MKKFLKEKEREYLKNSHRQEKNGRTRDKIKAILMADSGLAGRIKKSGRLYY